MSRRPGRYVSRLFQVPAEARPNPLPVGAQFGGNQRPSCSIFRQLLDDDDLDSDDDNLGSCEDLFVDFDDVTAAEARYDVEAEYRLGHVSDSPDLLYGQDHVQQPFPMAPEESMACDDAFDSLGFQSLTQLSEDFDATGYCQEMVLAQIEHGMSDTAMDQIFGIVSRYCAASNPPGSLFLARKNLGNYESFVDQLSFACEECGVLINEVDGKCCSRPECPNVGVRLHALNCGYAMLDMKRQLKQLLAGKYTSILCARFKVS